MSPRWVLPIWILGPLLLLHSGCNLFGGEPCQSDTDCLAVEYCLRGFCVVSDKVTADDPQVDAGGISLDGGGNPNDAGSSKPDAGVFLVDAGVIRDAGSAANDAGSQLSDAGSLLIDAGVGSDGGVLERPEVCDDGIDNDEDQRIDCLDSDCRDTSSCVPCTRFATASGVYSDCGQRMSMAAANIRCGALGARVMSIETLEEQSALASWLAGRLSWLGITDALVEGEYRSHTFPFRPPAHMPFAAGQPDNGVGLVARDGQGRMSAGGDAGVLGTGAFDAGAGDVHDSGAGPGDAGDDTARDGGARGSDAGHEADVPWPVASGGEEDCMITSADAWADVPCAGQTPFHVICEESMRRWTPLEAVDPPETDIRDFSVTLAPDGSSILFGGYKTIVSPLFPGGPVEERQVRTAEGVRWDFDLLRFQPLPPAPSTLLARTAHVAAYVGEQFVVWGGETDSGQTNHGARLVVPLSQWVDLPTLSAPQALANACGVALGRALFVFGGMYASGAPSGGNTYANEGGLYVLDEDRWISLPSTGLPSARSGHVCLALDENRVFVWGGVGPGTTSSWIIRSATLNTGAIYDRSANTWTPVIMDNAPSARAYMSAVTIGDKVILFGGRTLTNSNWRMASGGAMYDVANQSWTPLPEQNAPSSRYHARSIILGDEVLFFGGISDSATPLSDGALYQVTENRWRPINPRGAPNSYMPLMGLDHVIHFWSGGVNNPVFRYISSIPAIDRDDDGLVDAHELYLGTNPDDPDSNDDTISDGDAIEEELPFLP